MSQRRYGYFRCVCGSSWESSHVYCDDLKAVYKQECRSCKTACLPYRVEKLTCSICGRQDCICTREDKKKRHVDATKAHRSDLCLRCRSGRPCQEN